VDEQLVQYPWELLHDGDDYLCLKHSMGRYVNSSARPAAVSQVGPAATAPVDKVRILFISVPAPQPRDANTKYEPLPGVEEETQKVFDAVKELEHVELTLLKNATFNDVYNALRQTSYHIVHYSGHAHFDSKTPYLSGLVLNDRDMTTGPLSRYFGKSPPVLCFINGCESGTASGWAENYDIFGLAQSLLSTGAYLLGSRWKLADIEAATFASSFYSLFLKDLKPLGTAVLEARRTTKGIAGDAENFAWASYILYGDPRICFRLTDT
jgi:CHAT domain-containing protein